MDKINENWEIEETYKNKRFYKKIFIIYLFSLLISINFFFLIFVRNINDLSPNIALAVLTIPPALILLVEIFKKEVEC